MRGKFNKGCFVILSALVLTSACSGGSNNDDSNQPTQNAQTPGQTAGNAQGWQTIDMIANEAETKLDVLGHFDTSRNACGQEAYGTADLALWNQIAQYTNAAVSGPATSEDNMNCFDAPDGNRMDGSVDLILDPPTTHLFADVTPDAWPFPSHTPTPTSTPSDQPTSAPTSHPTPTPSWTPPTHSPSPSASPSPSPSSAGPTRRLFENRGGQVCTTIQNTQTAQQLLQALSQLTINADKQDCPNGYGH